MAVKKVIPLIIDGQDVFTSVSSRLYRVNRVGSTDGEFEVRVQGATKENSLDAVESSARAYTTWSYTDPRGRRNLFLNLAQLLRTRELEIRSIIEEEIACGPLWSEINLKDAIVLVEELAGLVTSDSLGGFIPLSPDSKSQALVYAEPLGVVLGIAPWNAPLILGMRAVAVPVAAGNTAILKARFGIKSSNALCDRRSISTSRIPTWRGQLPYTSDRGCIGSVSNYNKPPGSPVRKCNFTGSTAVGRIIAAGAGVALKPVLLELGGKNFVVVLEDADLDNACRLILEGAFLNNGQICMSTDTVLMVESIAELLETKLKELLPIVSKDVNAVINARSKARLEGLVKDAESKGAEILRAEVSSTQSDIFPATVIDRVSSVMEFSHTESFGPICGLRRVRDGAEAMEVIAESPYGLSAAIFTRNHFRALQMARKMKVGAIHINGATVHDAPNLPHGGHGDSGFGRFGARWGLEEFVHTKTIVLNE